MSLRIKFLVLQVIFNVPNSWAYHNGAPLQACTDLVPKHGSESQPTSDDHKLVLDKGKWNFRLGEKINLTLTLVDEHRAQFKGFLIQVIQFFSLFYYMFLFLIFSKFSVFIPQYFFKIHIF